jgi:hypothetical protein
LINEYRSPGQIVTSVVGALGFSVLPVGAAWLCFIWFPAYSVVGNAMGSLTGASGHWHAIVQSPEPGKSD